jgi:hypothetical protein
VNVVEKYYILMYEKGKRKPIETIPGLGVRKINKNDRGW